MVDVHWFVVSRTSCKRAEYKNREACPWDLSTVDKLSEVTTDFSDSISQGVEATQ